MLSQTAQLKMFNFHILFLQSLFWSVFTALPAPQLHHSHHLPCPPHPRNPGLTSLGGLINNRFLSLHWNLFSNKKSPNHCQEDREAVIWGKLYLTDHLLGPESENFILFMTKIKRWQNTGRYLVFLFGPTRCELQEKPSHSYISLLEWLEKGAAVCR